VKKIIALALVAMLQPVVPAWATDPDLVAEDRGPLDRPAPVSKPHSPLGEVYPAIPPAEGRSPWQGAYIGGTIDWVQAGLGHPVSKSFTGSWMEPGHDISAYEESSTGEVIGGLHAGYNWNVGKNIIAGIEADFQFTDLKGTSQFVNYD
jgi:hypothetical protein